MLGKEDLERFLKKHNLQAEIICFEEPVMSSKQAERLTKGNIVKSILLIADDKPLLCILPGNKQVDFEKVKRIKNAKEVRLAKAKEVKEISGYDIGSLPPFGHKQKIETIVDKAVLSFDTFYCGGGSHYCLLKITSKEFKKLFSDFRDISA